MNYESYSDDALLSELGRRLAQTRIARNLTQTELATEAGVSRSTVERLEAGRSTQLTKLLRIFRVLGIVDPIINAIPDQSISPIELLKLKSRRRKRVRHKEPQPGRDAGPWRWGDEE